MSLTRNVFSYRQKRIIINDSSRIYDTLTKANEINTKLCNILI